MYSNSQKHSETPKDLKVVELVGAFNIKQKHEIDISSLDQIANNADFSNEVNESISVIK